MKSRKFTKSIITLSLALLLSIFPTQVAFAATSTFSPSAVTIGINQNTTINVVATGGSDSNAADIVVSYNSSVVEPVSIVAGPGVSALGSGTLSPNLTLTVFKAGTNFSNGEVLAVITLKGKASGVATLDSTGTDIQPGGNTSPGTATVTVTTSVLPDAGLFDQPQQLIVLGLGSMVVIFGVFLALKARQGRVARSEKSGAV